jgi:hypothetical protein
LAGDFFKKAGRKNVHCAGSLFAIWGGRFTAGLLFVSGATHLWPAPPAWDQEIHTMILFVASMVPLSIGEFIAFYFAVLAGTPKNAKGLRQVKSLQHETFSLLNESVSALKKLTGISVKITEVQT